MVSGKCLFTLLYTYLKISNNENGSKGPVFILQLKTVLKDRKNTVTLNTVISSNSEHDSVIYDRK